MKKKLEKKSKLAKKKGRRIKNGKVTRKKAAFRFFPPGSTLSHYATG